MSVCMTGKGCGPSSIAYYLVIVGAINWGLVGLGDFLGGNWNLVNLIFGSMGWLESAIYIVVGICGVVTLMGCPCGTCKVAREEMKK